jgi:hypothetical protein
MVSASFCFPGDDHQLSRGSLQEGGVPDPEVLQGTFIKYANDDSVPASPLGRR